MDCEGVGKGPGPQKGWTENTMNYIRIKSHSQFLKNFTFIFQQLANFKLASNMMRLRMTLEKKEETN